MNGNDIRVAPAISENTIGSETGRIGVWSDASVEESQACRIATMIRVHDGIRIVGEYGHDFGIVRLIAARVGNAKRCHAGAEGPERKIREAAFNHVGGFWEMAVRGLVLVNGGNEILHFVQHPIDGRFFYYVRAGDSHQ